jgi:membrane protease YdiL (CAAX protease family)
MVTGEQARRRLVLLAVAFEGGLGLTACALGWWPGPSPWRAFALDAAGVLWGLIAAVPPVLGFLAMWRWPLGPLARLKRLSQEFVGPLFAPLSLAELALVAAAAGWGEELLFRGWLQAAATDWLGPAWGWAIACVLFGLMHPLSVTYVVLVVAAGAYFALLWWASDNLLAPMVTHAVYDFAALVYLTRWSDRSPQLPQPPDDPDRPLQGPEQAG